MEVTVIGGSGYVGLVTGIGLAGLGHSVTCADVDRGAIESLAKGIIPIGEPGLEAALARAMEKKRIAFTTDVVEACAGAEIVMVAVGTPSAADGAADLSRLFETIPKIALGFRLGGSGRRRVVAIKSTVPAGTCETFRDRLAAELGKAARNVDIASNPEFLREGTALGDFMDPDRIVVGCYRKRAARALRGLYRKLDAPFLAMDPRSSEMVKYACNAYLATRISFINEISGICSHSGADVRRVIDGMGRDKRIGRHYLSPGLGFGGPCLGKDLRALASLARQTGLSTPLLDAALERNERQGESALSEITALLGGLSRKTICLLGLSFKAGTADTRDSPSLALAGMLLPRGAELRAWDPLLSRSASALKEFPFLARDLLEALEGADCAVIMTEEPEFKRLDLERLAAAMRTKAIYDTRRIIDPKKALKAGFGYAAVGIAKRRLSWWLKKAEKRPAPEPFPSGAADRKMAEGSA